MASKVTNSLHTQSTLLIMLSCMVVGHFAAAAKYKASKSSVKTISKRLNYYFPDSESLNIKRLARKIAESKYNSFYFINASDVIVGGVSHSTDKDNHLPDGLTSIKPPKDMQDCQQTVVLRRYFTHFLEYSCNIVAGTVQDVRLINIVDLQSGEEVAYQPIEILKKIARNRHKKNKLAGNIVQFVADSYHISDYSWGMFNIITYNLVNYLLKSEKLELMLGGTHLLADVERVAEQANLPVYLLADFLKIEKLVKLYIQNVHKSDELTSINQELRTNLDRAAYTIAEVWREDLGDKQSNIPSAKNMLTVMHEFLIQHAENSLQPSD